MFRALRLLIGGCIASAAIVAHAQEPVSPYAYPYYGGAATVSESQSRGMAGLVSSAGQAHLNNSMAAINLTTAKSQELDNRMKGEQTYIQMRQMNEAYTKQQRGTGLTTEEAWRYAQLGIPKRLTSTQLDPVTGKIYWPLPLTNPKFDDNRKQIDALFLKREQAHGSIGYELYTQIEQTTNSLLEDLKKNVDDFNPNDYMKMKNFVESLAHEASLPTA